MGRASLVCRIEGGIKRGIERWDEERERGHLGGIKRDAK